MKLLPILLFALLIASSSVMASGIRCTATKQCAYMSVCDGGYCMTMDEMFEKYGMADSHRRGKRSLEDNDGHGEVDKMLEESGSHDGQEDPHPRTKRRSQSTSTFDGGY